MMTLPSGFTADEYLALEEKATVRHAYRYDLVYAMAADSDDHDELALNLIELLRQTVRDQGCEVRLGNVKVTAFT